jgi:hypothetical protein
VVDSLQLPEQWSDVGTLDLSVHGRWQRGRDEGAIGYVEGTILGGAASNQGYVAGELAAGALRLRPRSRLALRVFGGATSDDVPAQRALYVSSAGPLTTFYNHWWRPRGALLRRPGMNWLPLGGAALRGFSWTLADQSLIGGNAEAGLRLVSLPVDGAPGLWLNAFGDVAQGRHRNLLADAGIGIALRGQLYDRAITIRLDAPFYVNRPALGIERDVTERDQFAARWVLSFNDIW